MERIIRWFVNNSVASNLMMFFIILSGIATIPLLKMEVFPDIEVDIINVTAVYPGATPSDVENAVCVRIEERLQGLDGVKKITATAGILSAKLMEKQVEIALDPQLEFQMMVQLLP